jgi:hypothetical protein
MYGIEASVTTANKDQLGITGDWPLDWLHAVGFRSAEIIGKLGPTEKLSGPGVATELRELPGRYEEKYREGVDTRRLRLL